MLFFCLYISSLILTFCFFQNKKSNPSAGDIDNDLVSTKHELLRIREMLEMAEKVRQICFTYENWNKWGFFVET
jgi:hypothetical protein